MVAIWKTSLSDILIYFSYWLCEGEIKSGLRLLKCGYGKGWKELKSIYRTSSEEVLICIKENVTLLNTIQNRKRNWIDERKRNVIDCFWWWEKEKRKRLVDCIKRGWYKKKKKKITELEQEQLTMMFRACQSVVSLNGDEYILYIYLFFLIILSKYGLYAI